MDFAYYFMNKTLFDNYIDIILPDYNLGNPVKIAELLDRTLKFVAVMPGKQQRLDAVSYIHEKTAITLETLMVKLKNIRKGTV